MAGRTPRDGRRPRADRGGPRVVVRGRDRRRVCRRREDLVRGDAVPHRHRPESARVKYAVVTFGCRVNQADSLGFGEDLLRAGATAAPPDEADLVVVNTCSVTATAD